MLSYHTSKTTQIRFFRLFEFNIFVHSKATPTSYNDIGKAPRPLFIGACELCTPHSRATLGAEKATSIQGLINVLSSHRLVEESKDVKLLEQADSYHIKCFKDEHEFETKVMHSERRHISSVISSETQYNFAG